MDIRKIVGEIDQKIASLQQARAVLLHLDGNIGSANTRRSRPKAGPPSAADAKKPSTRKRNLTPEGRKRIAEAVKRRWAESRQDAAPARKSVAKKQA